MVAYIELVSAAQEESNFILNFGSLMSQMGCGHPKQIPIDGHDENVVATQEETNLHVVSIPQTRCHSWSAVT